ncbi:hypothetical protein GCK72_001607 [Caenorhabditis remanei]|uniref:Tyrosine-protein phosphatase domain-containing protein n=1 Tax=Caenorhabditis remanei TaxID=31234 RepID=A0A6A5HNF9_CAERE|nr:hypothetical protein GCK72_001607 [Caenorhabditis remanei]KAF1769790.1 hypothetical protein GCK72_001607 [Caenorhabditis remanei]
MQMFIRRKGKNTITVPRNSKEKDKALTKDKEKETSKKKMRTKSKSERETQQASQVMEESVNDNKEKKIQRKQIVGFVKQVLEKNPAGLKEEFKVMKRFNDFEKMKSFKAAQELGKNRYKDVGCLDNNRVKLGKPWSHDYIHANYVAVPTNPKRFICTQAPLEKTCADFWFMCLQDKVEAIFMLCNLTEKGAKKCFEYYPSKEKPMEFEEKGQKITVKFESSNKGRREEV